MGIYISLINYIMVVVPVLINVAFITLLERKILGLRQLRKGPHKVSMVGIFQPFRDAIKLFSNEALAPYVSNHKQFFLSPLLSIFIVLSVYMTFPSLEIVFGLSLRIIFIYIIISINVYPLIIRG